jgi:hypothetical protein
VTLGTVSRPNSANLGCDSTSRRVSRQLAVVDDSLLMNSGVYRSEQQSEAVHSILRMRQKASTEQRVEYVASAALARLRRM